MKTNKCSTINRGLVNDDFGKIKFSALPFSSRATKHATITIPSGSKNTSDRIINIDTNVDITASITPMCSLTYLLPRINICIIFSLFIIILLAINSVEDQVIQLKQDIATFKNEMELSTKNYDDLKFNLEQLARRCDDMTPKRYKKHLRQLVERAAEPTIGYDDTSSSAEVTIVRRASDLRSVTDSGRNGTNQSIVPESEQVQLPKLDVLSLTNFSQEKIIRDQEKHSTIAAEIDDKGYSSADIEEQESSMNQTDEMMYNDGPNPEDDHALSVNSDSEGNDTRLDDYGSPRTSRAKRSSGRGILSVHFMGAKPEIVIRDGGLVAPWFLDDSAAGTFGLSRFNLREGRGVVEITDAGLYYIYAQVYYLTTERTNSFLIKLRRQDKSELSVATCSVNAAINISGDSTEVTCYTSIVRYLNPGEQIYLQQQERDRLVLMKEGQTFLGLVRLHSEKPTQKA